MAVFESVLHLFSNKIALELPFFFKKKEHPPLKANNMSGGGRGFPDEHPIDIDIDHDPNAMWVKEFISSVNKQRGRRLGNKPHTIFKIQDCIHLRNEDAYRPLLISIGPYYNKCLPTSNNYVIMLEN